jgi:hypothetical protein
VTATISDQTFSSSVYRAFTVAGDADLIAGNIKSGINLFNVVGNVAPPPANCTSDGADGCVVDGTSYKAAKLSQFSPGDIKSGVTIAGVSGSLGNCGADGVAGCVVVGPTMAAAVTTGIGSKILSGSTIAGVSGNVTLPAAGKVLTGTQYGVFGTGSTGTLTLPAAAYVLSGSGSFGDPGAAVTPTLTLPVVGDVFAGIQYGAGGTSSTGTLTLASAANVRTSQGAFGRGGNSVTPTLADCASDGATGCVAVTGYKAANMTNVTEATIRSGVTIAGVTGNFPSATHPLSDASATTDLSSLAASTSAGSYEWWSSNGTRYTGTISDAGTINPTTATQTFNTSVYRTFTVAGNGNLTAANIKNGTTIFGVTGAYPSSTYPLAGADNTADLDFATFDAKIKSTVDFEWFDAAGNRYTNTGDADIAAGNLKDGISIFGTAGTLIGGPYCTGDGQTSCVTSSRYKSMDTDSTVISVWDIRKGKAAGGLTGELVFHRSMANTGNFNRTSGTGALSGVDVYDTIDDYNNGGAFPTQNPAGWYQATGANWLRNSVSDVGGGVSGVAGDGICNGSEACVYTDRLTDLSWLRDDGTTRNWESAIAYCEGLTSGGYSDWRLPTQKELMQAYTNGIWSQKAATRLDLAVSSSILYWSSSTRSYDTTYAFRVSLVSGYVWSDAKTTANYAVCVR